MPVFLPDARAGDARQPLRPVVPLHDAALPSTKTTASYMLSSSLASKDDASPGRAFGRGGCSREVPIGVGRLRIERKQPARGHLPAELSPVAFEHLHELPHQDRVELRSAQRNNSAIARS